MYDFIKLNDEEDVEIEDLSIEYQDYTDRYQNDDYTHSSSAEISDDKIKNEAIFLNNDIFTFERSDAFFNKNVFEKTDKEDVKVYKIIIRCGAWNFGEIYIGTNKEYRNKGYASLAVKYVIEHKGGKYARIFAGNKPSVNLFKSLGFKIYLDQSKLEDYYHGGGIIYAILPQYVDEVLNNENKYVKRKWIEYTDEVFKKLDTEENEKGRYYENHDLIYEGQELSKEDSLYAQSVIIASAKGIDERFFKNNFPFLKKVVIKENTISKIPEKFFYDKTRLETAIIESNVSEIGDGAFYHCRSLKEVKLPNSVKSIGASAFDDCPSLVSINVPSSLQIIGGSAFENCSSLREMTLPSGIKKIGECSFSNLDNFKLFIPKGEDREINKDFFKHNENSQIITDDPKIKEACKKHRIKCTYQGEDNSKKYKFTKVE